MKFLSDTRGNVLMLTGLAILILFAIAGAGVDFGRQQLVRMKLQNASDAAAVAAASLPDSTTTEQRRQVALRYFNLNYPSSYLGIARPAPNIDVSNSGITVTANTSFDANFVSNVGVTNLAAEGRTVVNRTGGQNAVYDVILVMDNSTSMAELMPAPAYANTPAGERGGYRTQIIQICSNEMLAQFQTLCNITTAQYMSDGVTQRQYGNRSNCVAQAPRDWCTSIPDTHNPSSTSLGYSFIDNTRLNALRSVALNFVQTIIDDGEPGSRIGLVAYGSNVILNRALNSNSASVRQSLNQMAAYGATNPYSAMQAANSMAGTFQTDHVKAVVLLSDGMPTTTGGTMSYTIQGNRLVARDSSGCNGSAYCGPAVTNTMPICTQLKNAGVQVYTIGFLSPTDPDMTNADRANARAFLRSCASVDQNNQPRYWEAPTGAELDQAFTQVLTALGKIKITQ